MEYRERASRPDEPRLIVLVDGVGSFRTAYEGTSLSRYWDIFQSLAADGRALGIHFVISADRPGAVSSSLSSAVQRRLVLRLANEMDYVMVDAPSDGFAQTSPPGRGFHRRRRDAGGGVQRRLQRGRAGRAAGSLRGLDATSRACPRPPRSRAFPSSCRRPTLPATAAVSPTLGIWDETLEPIGFPVTGTFLVSGPPLERQDHHRRHDGERPGPGSPRRRDGLLRPEALAADVGSRVEPICDGADRHRRSRRGTRRDSRRS